MLDMSFQEFDCLQDTNISKRLHLLINIILFYFFVTHILLGLCREYERKVEEIGDK